jgi:hypothetical protein
MTGDDHRCHDGRWAWLIAASDPDAPPEDWPDGRSTFRGILVAVPLSGLLWWGLVELWRAFA